MNKLTFAILLLVADAVLVAGGLFAMRAEDGTFQANPLGVGAIALGAVACFLGLVLLMQSFKERQTRR